MPIMRYVSVSVTNTYHIYLCVLKLHLYYNGKTPKMMLEGRLFLIFFIYSLIINEILY